MITIRFKQNGPLVISLEDAPQIRIEDYGGNPVEPTPDRPIKLCRCGASMTKPFCDGTHRQIGFDGATAAARALDAPRGDTDVPQL
ncbi:MAG: CDGSH iron-sulfur domain-containing protein [Gemmatimonadaceae bacterium]